MFGYCVADEVLLYLWNARALDEADFDYQICQKILPKFHGSEAKITQMLDALDKEGFANFA